MSNRLFRRECRRVFAKAEFGDGAVQDMVIIRCAEERQNEPGCGCVPGCLTASFYGLSSAVERLAVCHSPDLSVETWIPAGFSMLFTRKKSMISQESHVPFQNTPKLLCGIRNERSSY
ncbi:MAG: hypothetical protein ACKO3T_27295 [Planctomycetaceae bacterium]